MRRLLAYILAFFCVMGLADHIFGMVCDYLGSHAKGGDTQWHHYIARQMTDDIVVFGSSRATHHYVPEVLKEATRLECANCGKDGNGIILHYGRYLLFSQRYLPKIVVYDISYNFDLKPADDNLKYIDYLKPYAQDSLVDDYISGLFPDEHYKMKSAMYCYNTKLLQMVNDFVRPKVNSHKGYKPMHKVLDYEPNEPEWQPVEPDPLKMQCLEQLIIRCRHDGVPMLFSISPMYKGKTPGQYLPVVKLCEKYNLPLVSFYNTSEMCQDRQFFNDLIHLNDKGARRFSQQIAEYVKATLERKLPGGLILVGEE